MFLSDCLPRLCDWDLLVNDHEYGVFMDILHVLKRHPDHFREVTGKDPEEYERHISDLYGPEAVRRFKLDA